MPSEPQDRRSERALAYILSANVAIIAAIGGWFYFDVTKDCRDERIGLAVAPGGRFEEELLLRDCPGQFLLDFSHLALRLRLHHAPWIWREAATFDVVDLRRVQLPMVWTDDRHLVVTFGAGGGAASEHKTVLGVDIDIRRGAEPTPSVAPVRP